MVFRPRMVSRTRSLVSDEFTVFNPVPTRLIGMRYLSLPIFFSSASGSCRLPRALRRWHFPPYIHAKSLCPFRTECRLLNSDFFVAKLYTINLSFVSIRDLYQLLKGVLLDASRASRLCTPRLWRHRKFPSFRHCSWNFLLSIVLLGSVRILKRMIRDVRRYRTGKKSPYYRRRGRRRAALQKALALMTDLPSGRLSRW